MALFRWARRRRRDELDKQMRHVRALNLTAALEAVLADVWTADDPEYVRTVHRIASELLQASATQLWRLELRAEEPKPE
jgi:nitrogen fixation/metabolism regulation signal transduction histidine kinase